MATAQNDVIRIVAQMRYANAADVNNIYHVRQESATPVDDADFMDAIADYIDAAYGGMVGSLPDDLSFTQISGQNITQNVVMPTVGWPGQVTGGGATDAMPPQIASMVWFPTLLPGVQGRKYLPAFTEALYVNGVITAGGIALLDTFGQLFLGAIAILGATVTFGVYRKTDGRFTPYVNIRVQPNARTQRRRTVGFGS